MKMLGGLTDLRAMKVSPPIISLPLFVSFIVAMDDERFLKYIKPNWFYPYSLARFKDFLFLCGINNILRGVSTNVEAEMIPFEPDAGNADVGNV
jgi:hypothetical protein